MLGKGPGRGGPGDHDRATEDGQTGEDRGSQSRSVMAKYLIKDVLKGPPAQGRQEQTQAGVN